ncbi:LemA family protein [uncultured archaeon]|nr:LemA family protein [uncultured archaeon]
MDITLWIIVGIIVLVGIIFIYYYNKFKRLDIQAQADWNLIDPLLQQRLDTIPNLITMAKRVMKQEIDLFTGLAKARESAMKATSVPEKIAANQKLGAMISGFYARAESYPELKSDNTMRVAMEELSGIEDKIKYGRQKYDYTVQEYTETASVVPGAWFASMYGVNPNKWAYFKADDQAKKGINAEELLK